MSNNAPGSSIADALEAFAADHVWVDQNRESLLGEYADEWVAVKDGRVIEHDADFDELLRKLPDPAHTCIEFITREPLEMIL